MPDSIDWNEVYRRLAAASAAIEAADAPSFAEQEEICRLRARKLAEELPPEQAGEVLEVLNFQLDREEYGIETQYVQEVYPLKEYTALPGTPEFIVGLVNVRGRILSLLSIKALFALPDQGLGELNKVLILQHEEMEFGILADAVSGVTEIRRAELEPPLATMTGLHSDFMLGLTRQGRALLNGWKLLHDPRILVE